jgi:hypothetical protein
MAANLEAEDVVADYTGRVVAGVRSGESASLRRMRAELKRAIGSKRYERGVRDALIAVIDAALGVPEGRHDLAPQSALLEPGSLPERMLLEIARGVRGANTDLADRLDTDQWQVSRAGRRLRELGLATRVRTGRLNRWQLTTAGEAEASRLVGGRRGRT